MRQNPLVPVLGLFSTAAIAITIPHPVIASESEVREAFEAYRVAILNRDADSAHQKIDSNTKKYYAQMLQSALTDNKEKVKAKPILDQLIILRSRHQIPSAELPSMDGESFFKYAVNRGWIDPSSVRQAQLAEVEILGNTATTKIAKNGQAAPFGFDFNQEMDGWKIDLTSILAISEGAMQQLIRESGMSQTEFVIFLVESVSGSEVQDSVWEPLR